MPSDMENPSIHVIFRGFLQKLCFCNVPNVNACFHDIGLCCMRIEKISVLFPSMTVILLSEQFLAINL